MKCHHDLLLLCRLYHPLSHGAVCDGDLAVRREVVRSAVQHPLLDLVGGEDLRDGLLDAGVAPDILDFYLLAAL